MTNNHLVSSIEPKAWFIISVTKNGIGLDLSYPTQQQATDDLNSDLYTDRQRKIRQVVPYYKLDGSEYIKVSDKLIKLAL